MLEPARLACRWGAAALIAGSVGRGAMSKVSVEVAGEGVRRRYEIDDATHRRIVDAALRLARADGLKHPMIVKISRKSGKGV